MEYLSSLLSHKFDVDERDPIFFFSLPFGEDSIFGITGMDPRFWLINFLFLALQSFTNIVAAIIIYKFILLQRGSWQSYLIGYGLVCPVLFYLPLYLIPVFDLRNAAFLSTIALASPAIMSFRCCQAMHGCLPPFAFDETNPSVSRFIRFNSATLAIRFNPKTREAIPFATQEAIGRLVKFGRIFLETTILYSVLLPANYKIFPHREIHSIVDLAYWGNICNNYCMAYLTGSVLEAGATGLGIWFSLITGLSTTEFHDEPLTQSTSPSDFWGNRWNKLVNRELRNGVFRPLRNAGFHRSLAAFCTFATSGLLHEYVLFVSTLRGAGAAPGEAVYQNNPTREPFTPSYGNHLIFFAWNGLVLLGEHLLSDTAVVLYMRNNLPRPARTALVLLTVLPISHLFTDEYIASCFYSDIAMGFPRIDKIR